jgi:hypothetical protein
MEAEWSRQVGTPTSPKVLEQRLSVRIHRIPTELLYSSKLEPRNPVGPRRIPIELPRLSYEEGSWQARRPSGPHNFTTLPTRLCLATIIRMRALQVEFPSNDVCVLISTRGGIYRVVGELHRLSQGGNRHVATGWPGGTASTTFLHRFGLPLLM